MAFSAALHANFLTFSSHRYSKLCSLRLNRKQKKLVVTRIPKRKGNSVQMIRSVLGNRKSSTASSDNGATEPATVLLERVFAQTQKLEARMSRDSSLSQDIQLGFNLEILESDLVAALAALRKKEEDLQDAERMVLLEHSELNCAKQELEQREGEIAVARSKQEKLEKDHKQANDNLASQARQIEDLKLLVKEQDQEIVTAQFAVTLKEDDLNRMRNELAKTSDEAAKNESDLRSRDLLLNEANEVIKKQDAEVQELQKAVREKEQELEVSVVLRKLEEEKLKLAETNLRKRTMEWLSTQEEVKKLAEEASKHTGETNQTLEDFRRVKKLLADVRSELVSSQKSLAFSRQKMEEQEHQLKKQLAELEEQKIIIMSYMMSLNDAQIEVESEKASLRVAEARNKELELELSTEKELMERLQEELNKERSSLTQALQEISVLWEELDQKTSEFGEAQKLLQFKESDLVEARLQIQHLISEQASMQQILREKDTDLLNAQKKLEEVNQEVAELKNLMNSREDELIQVTAMLQEKEKHVQIMQHELDDTKMKFSEAATAVERIVDLTNKMVISVKDKDSNALILERTPSEMEHMLEKPKYDFTRQKKQMETELELTRESLRMKEMEVLASQRALTIKDEELNMVLNRLEAREKELKSMKEDMMEDANDLKKLYALAQERIGDKSMGDLAIEKLQIEAAQLEVEAATTALCSLADMSREVLENACLSIDVDTDTFIFSQSGSDPWPSVAENNECFAEAKREVARLSALTERIVKEAGIVGAVECRLAK